MLEGLANVQHDLNHSNVLANINCYLLVIN